MINEINYHPPLGGDEFIELKSITNGVLNLYDVNFPTNRWKLNGVGYDFPPEHATGRKRIDVIGRNRSRDVSNTIRGAGKCSGAGPLSGVAAGRRRDFVFADAGCSGFGHEHGGDFYSVH